MNHFKFVLSCLLVLLAIQKGFAQNTDTTDSTLTGNKLLVFIDCRRCDDSYIRNEVRFINFVRDKEDAQIHILVTRQGTGSGTEFTLQFLGRKQFAGQDNNLKYNSPDSDTDDDERRGLVQKVKLGLFTYVSQTDIVDNLDIIYDPDIEITTKPDDDPWDNWIFELDGRMSVNGEELSNRLFLSGGIQAERITEAWKIRMELDYDYNRRKETFSETDSLGNNFKITDVFITKGQQFEGSVIKSVGKRWATGIFGETFSSTRNNYDLNINGGPGVEYNIFPYQEYTQREFTVSYILRPSYRNYADTTIFNKAEEFLLRHELRSRAQFTQPWGEVEGRANFSAFTQDFSKNRLDINLQVDFRIFRGLSLNLEGRYSLINDQLAIPKGNITDAEQLLNLRQRLTGYSYGASIGIEYTFGSIFNSVVNPRF